MKEKEVIKMYKNITHYCPKCGKITEWRKKNPKGKWYCIQCKAGGKE